MFSKIEHWNISTHTSIYTKHTLGEPSKKKPFFLWKVFPNVWTHPPTPGFLWDLGKQKVKFESKKAILGVIFFLGFWTLFGNQPPHPPTLGKKIPKKTCNFGLWLPLGKRSEVLKQIEQFIRFYLVSLTYFRCLAKRILSGKTSNPRLPLTSS